jgi:hypothetical protein
MSVLEGIYVALNVDVGECRRVGVDPATSEGNLRIRTLLLEALEFYAERAPLPEIDGQERALIGALLLKEE